MKIANVLTIVALLLYGATVALLSIGSTKEEMWIGDRKVNTEKFFFLLAFVGGCTCGLLILIHWKLGGLVLVAPELEYKFRRAGFIEAICLSWIYGWIVLKISGAIRGFERRRIKGGSISNGGRQRGSDKENKKPGLIKRFKDWLSSVGKSTTHYYR